MAKKKPAPEDCTPASYSGSWSIVLTSHIRQGSDLDFVFEELRHLKDSYRSSSANDQIGESFITGEFVDPSVPWAVCVRHAREPWAFLSGPRVDEEMARQMGQRKKLRTLYFGFDARESKSFFRSYEDGKIQVDFHASGPPLEPIGKTRLKSKIPIEGLIEKASTPAAAIESILKHYDAQRMRLQVIEKDAKFQLVHQTGKPLAVKSFRDFLLLKYYPLLPGDNPASDLLATALDEGNPENVKSAVAAGASLRWLPASLTSPLEMATLNKKGRWQDCARVLVKAGAPVDGAPDEKPPLFVTCTRFGSTNVRGMDDNSMVQAIELLLELGANIDAINPTSHLKGWTVLHHAITNCQVVIVKYLVSRGADITLENDKGESALKMARNHVKHFSGEFKEKSTELVRFLTDFQAGTINDHELSADIRVELNRTEAVVQQKSTAQEESFWQTFSQMVMNEPETLEIKILPPKDGPHVAKPLVSQIEKAGFTKIGNFEIVDSLNPLTLIAFHLESKNLYAVVYLLQGFCCLDLMRFHRNGTVVHVADQAIRIDFSPRANNEEELPVRHYLVADGTVSELIEAMEGLPIPQQGIETVEPAEFIERMKQQHALDVAGQKRVAMRILESPPAPGPAPIKVKRKRSR